MKPLITLYEYDEHDPEVSSPHAFARNICREMLMSPLRHDSLRRGRGLRVVVERPFGGRVVSVNKILHDYYEDFEEVFVGPSSDVVMPHWISRAPPLLHAVLGFLRNPVPAHRVQLMAICTVLSKYEYRREFDRLQYNGCQTFCIFANPGVWTSGVLNYLETLRKPWRTLEQLDPHFRSAVLYNEGVIDIEHILEILTRNFRSPKPLRLEILPGTFNLRSFSRVARITADGASTPLSSLVFGSHEVTINEAFGEQHVLLMSRDLIRHAAYPITDGV